MRVLRWIFKCKSDVAAAGGAQNRHPEKQPEVRWVCTYLELEAGFETEESCEDSIAEERAGAIRLNLHRRRRAKDELFFTHREFQVLWFYHD